MRFTLVLPFLLVACGDSTQENPSPTPMFDAAVADTARPATDSAVADTASEDASAADTSTEPRTDAGPDTAGSFCGGIAGKTCDAGYYCFMDTGKCMAPDAGGRCAPIPSGCTKELNPVCGCDGKDYSNPCMAAAAGVNVAKTGACASEGTCSCGKTQYCDYATGCSGAGTCRTRPELCPGIYDPVCGCNGVTYSNECAAHAAGVDFASKDACSK